MRTYINLGTHASSITPYTDMNYRYTEMEWKIATNFFISKSKSVNVFRFIDKY